MRSWGRGKTLSSSKAAAKASACRISSSSSSGYSRLSSDGQDRWRALQVLGGRPPGGTSKPANGRFPELRCCTLPFAFWASLISEISRWKPISSSKLEKVFLDTLCGHKAVASSGTISFGQKELSQKRQPFSISCLRNAGQLGVSLRAA